MKICAIIKSWDGTKPVLLSEIKFSPYVVCNNLYELIHYFNEFGSVELKADLDVYDLHHHGELELVDFSGECFYFDLIYVAQI